MTLQEAITEANSRSRNINLQWFVCEWNDGYCINSTTHIKRFNTPFVYATGDINKSWDIEYDKTEKRFKHKVVSRK